MVDSVRGPDCHSARELDEVLAELVRREPIFHRREYGTARDDFERLTDPSFWEIGASGRIYSREHVWSVLDDRYLSDPSGRLDGDWETSGFELREIAPATYLMRYTLRLDGRHTRRTTLWQQRDGDWKILHHQGTVIAVHES
ncbi:DUF4440 domain-containing protein [Rhodococcus sp. IEGM 1381]|uniref:nuclear transport factor 2 family protein n=1 Tax=Rhodococcus sp. IEGM 1381 TaxID=3047085 RepID=UPI0024B77448|nr:DUF4440 domain-containing protein [Rhodococcus sp. IEGM 1381]MDI9898038.1 DUF4440 domain-containing protein [Rhodococcus sp. IEGM 1381]